LKSERRSRFVVSSTTLPTVVGTATGHQHFVNNHEPGQARPSILLHMQPNWANPANGRSRVAGDYIKVGTNEHFKVEPTIVHFGGYDVKSVHRTTVRITNVSSVSRRLTILPTNTPFFKVLPTTPLPHNLRCNPFAPSAPPALPGACAASVAAACAVRALSVVRSGHAPAWGGRRGRGGCR
jgi:hypothetical protein